MTAQWSQSRDQFIKLNPSFVHMLWTDATMLLYVARHKTIEELVMFTTMPPVMRADVFRYWIVHDIGGVYSDMDVQPLLSVEKWLSDDNVCALWGLEVDLPSDEAAHNVGFSYAKQYVQWSFVSIPRHPILRRVSSMILERWRQSNGTRYEESDAVNVTGPKIVTMAIAEYLSRHRSSTGTTTSNDRDANFDCQTEICPPKCFAAGGYGTPLSVGGKLLIHKFAGSWKTDGTKRWSML